LALTLGKHSEVSSNEPSRKLRPVLQVISNRPFARFREG
jgi:hypothetical protein